MVIKTTRWTPDTCGCTIEYTWDSESSQETRVHTHARTLVNCPEHEMLSGQELQGAMENECFRKSMAFDELLKGVPTIGEDAENEDGEVVRQLKRSLRLEFFFTGVGKDRVLHIGIKRKKTGLSELTIPQKNAIQSVANARFGTGKVVVE